MLTLKQLGLKLGRATCSSHITLRFWLVTRKGCSGFTRLSGGHQAFRITAQARERVMNAKTVTTILVVAILSATVTYIVVKSPGGDATAPTPTEDTKKPKDKDSITINYAVNTAGDGLEITANNSEKCDGSTKPGCLKVKKSKTGLIEFVFADADDWNLTQFTICAGSTPIEESCAADLTLDEQLEFFVMDDSTGTTILLTPDNGQVKLTQLQTGAKFDTFYLFDQNTIHQKYYYNIKACPDGNDDGSDDGCVYLDPPLENKGRD